MKSMKARFLVLSLIAIIFGVFSFKTSPDLPQSPESDTAQLTFVDVGQGDATFLKLPSGETFLIDGGEDDDFENGLDPFLASCGISNIDYAIITHYHTDHTGGIMELLSLGRIKNLIIPAHNPKSKAKERILAAAQKSETFVREISAGYTMSSEGQEFELSTLFPEKGHFDENENNNSLVLMLKYFKTKVLVTGDLEEDKEKIVAKEFDLETDILNVGHHGSYTSTCAEFLEAADPTYAVIECGAGNSYGHPHYEVLSRLEDDDVRIYRTDKFGHITFSLSEKGIEAIETTKN